MDRKLGVYVCRGCSIGECVDAERLAAIGRNEGKAAVVRSSAAFCLEDAGQIRQDVERGEVDAVVIAACSPRVNTDVFAFPGATVERVNLREQVAWSHPPGHEETQALADDALRIGLVRAQKQRPPSPFTEANARGVLVVGGGVAGLSAALGAADAGMPVTLVEQGDRLGGYAASLRQQYPKRPPYRELEAVDVAGLAERVRAHPDVSVHLGTTVQGIGGQPGRFEVTLATGGEARDLTVGAIVWATGFRPHHAGLEAYGLGRVGAVVTSVALEAMARAGRIVRPSDGGAVRTVAFLLCDGADDGEMTKLVGSVSHLVALKQAAYVRALEPEATVYVVYRDMQTPGQTSTSTRPCRTIPACS